MSRDAKIGLAIALVLLALILQVAALVLGQRPFEAKPGLLALLVIAAAGAGVPSALWMLRHSRKSWTRRTSSAKRVWDRVWSVVWGLLTAGVVAFVLYIDAGLASHHLLPGTLHPTTILIADLHLGRGVIRRGGCPSMISFVTVEGRLWEKACVNASLHRSLEWKERYPAVIRESWIGYSLDSVDGLDASGRVRF